MRFQKKIQIFEIFSKSDQFQNPIRDERNSYQGKYCKKQYFYCNFKIVIICVNRKLVMTGSKHQGDKVSNENYEE